MAALRTDVKNVTATTTTTSRASFFTSRDIETFHGSGYRRRAMSLGPAHHAHSRGTVGSTDRRSRHTGHSSGMFLLGEAEGGNDAPPHTASSPYTLSRFLRYQP